MNRIDPILVAWDGSREARAAASYARALSASLGTLTLLVHVTDPRDELVDVTRGRTERRRAAVERELDREIAQFTSPVERVMVSGQAAQRLLAEAKDRNAGLVVMGTRGRGRMGRAILGSVAEEVLRRIDRPVLVAHRETPSVRRVIVGVDGSNHDHAVVAAARAVAHAAKADLLLAHVLLTDPSLAARPESFGLARDVWEEAMKSISARVFDPLRVEVGELAETKLLYGVPDEDLRKLARESRAEIVAVGRRGKAGRGIEHLFSTAMSLAMRGPHATLVVT
ncbi:MAG: universal stress protein [Myxococcota bacterium]